MGNGAPLCTRVHPITESSRNEESANCADLGRCRIPQSTSAGERTGVPESLRPRLSVNSKVTCRVRGQWRRRPSSLPTRFRLRDDSFRIIRPWFDSSPGRARTNDCAHAGGYFEFGRTTCENCMRARREVSTDRGSRDANAAARRSKHRAGRLSRHRPDRDRARVHGEL